MNPWIPHLLRASGGGGGGGGFFPGISESDMYLPLMNTLVPTRGASTPTFTRATVAWDFDSEGKLNLNIPSGCPRFTGARFVRNLVTGSSEDFTIAAWTKGRASYSAGKLFDTAELNTHRMYQQVSTTPGTYTITVEAKAAELVKIIVGVMAGGEALRHRALFDLVAGSASTNDGSGPAPIITQLADGWFSCQVTGTCISTDTSANVFVYTANSSGARSYLGTGTDGVFIRRIQAENVSGQADQTASEYVSVGVLSAPFHGAGVDGCKYFTTNKDGSAIPAATLKGYYAEPSRVNNCLWGRDATNAAWTKSNVTAAKTATGLDNVANSASRLTAAANDATLLQLLTAATGTRTTSVWIKRVSGSGTVSLTRNGGTGWTDITSSLVTGTWVPVSLTSDVGANPTVGLKMGTSGDVIDVDCFQDENGAWRTSPILTTTAAVTRNADVLSYASAFDVTQGTSLCSIKSDVPHNTSDIYFLNGDSANASIGYLLSAVAKTTSYVYDGTSNTTAAGLSVTTNISKRASRWGPNLRVCADGTLGAQVAFDGSMGATATLYVGCSQASINHLSGNIGEVHIWTPPLTDAQMQQVTS
jgi:hypothetical protein